MQNIRDIILYSTIGTVGLSFIAITIRIVLRIAGV